MTQIVEKALRLWGFEGAEWELIAARENHVFCVRVAGHKYALRMHREGLHSDAALNSELSWMAAVGAEGVCVPTPVPSNKNCLLHLIDGVQVDMLTWMGGRQLGATGKGIDHPDRTGIFYAVGREMARLHAISDKWQRPLDFSRWSWDRDGLVGSAPLWDRFWENPILNESDRALFKQFREAADIGLQAIETELDYGLIHADLVRENVMVDGDRVSLIDFDDAGFGFRLFDIATTLQKNMDEPDYEQLSAAFLSGYRSQRPIDTVHLELFIALRAATYVGWVSSRMQEEGSELRNRRFVDAARSLAVNYLENRKSGRHP